ncbi:MAG: hypothetical protein LBB20_02580 [Puniceicoccales bacterium]|nr:hypothetical protein [Puniceicoccales bacterium]
MNKIEKFFEKENFGKLLLRLIIGGFIMTKGVVYISSSATALQPFKACCKLLFGVNGISPAVIIPMSLLYIIFGTFFLIGFHFRTNTFLLLLIFIAKTAFSYLVTYNWMDPFVLHNLISCAIMLSYLFIGPGAFCADKHK